MKRKFLFIFAITLLLSSVFTACSNEPNNPVTPSDGLEEEKYAPYPYEDLSIFMELPEFTNLSVSENDIEKFINIQISEVVDSEKLYINAPDGAEAQNWNKTVIDFVGVVDGEEFEGGTGKDYPLVLGSGSFVPGFEAGMIGMKVGDVRPITFNFPENYYENLAGKEVTFTVTLKELYILPEINDEFCSKYTYCKNMTEFYSTLRTECLRNYAFNTLLERCELKSYPKEYTEYYQSFITYFSEYAKEENLSLEVFISTYGGYFKSYGLHSGITLDGFYTVAENYAKSNCVNDLLMQSIIRKEGIQTSGEGYEKAKSELLRAYEGKTLEQLEEKYGKVAVITSIMRIQATDSLVKYVEITSNNF